MQLRQGELAMVVLDARRRSRSGLFLGAFLVQHVTMALNKMTKLPQFPAPRGRSPQQLKRDFYDAVNGLFDRAHALLPVPHSLSLSLALSHSSSLSLPSATLIAADQAALGL